MFEKIVGAKNLISKLELFEKINNRKSTIGRLTNWMKAKTIESKLSIYKNRIPEVQKGVLKDEYK